MKNRSETSDGVKELRKVTEGDHVFWLREWPQLKRGMTIFLETLTPEQQPRLNQIEQELLVMAYEASEETRIKTVLKWK